MSISEPIYKRDTKDKVRIWRIEVDGDKYRTIAGIQGGKMVTTKWTVAKPKNVGRSNATTPVEQAALEAAADIEKKLKREYRRTIPELEFVPYGVMLAETYGKHKFELPFDQGVWAQPKLDGIRSMKNVQHGATTREFQPHHNCAHLMERLGPLFSKYNGIQFDGELYNHGMKADFNGLSSLIRKQKVSAEQRTKIEQVVQFHVYDKPDENENFGIRTARLQEIIAFLNDPMIVFVPTEKIESHERLDEVYGQWLADGYEGQMIRLNEVYHYDRRPWALMKRKDFITEEFPIKAIEEGNGNWSGKAKRVVLNIPTAPDGEVGCGMRGNEEFATDLLSKVNAGRMPKIATVRHFGFTPDGSLRFPVAIDFHQEARVD